MKQFWFPVDKHPGKNSENLYDDYIDFDDNGVIVFFDIYDDLDGKKYCELKNYNNVHTITNSFALDGIIVEILL